MVRVCFYLAAVERNEELIAYISHKKIMGETCRRINNKECRIDKSTLTAKPISNNFMQSLSILNNYKSEVN